MEDSVKEGLEQIKVGKALEVVILKASESAATNERILGIVKEITRDQLVMEISNRPESHGLKPGDVLKINKEKIVHAEEYEVWVKSAGDLSQS